MTCVTGVSGCALLSEKLLAFWDSAIIGAAAKARMKVRVRSLLRIFAFIEVGFCFGLPWLLVVERPVPALH
jgi:hypothetical protein